MKHFYVLTLAAVAAISASALTPRVEKLKMPTTHHRVAKRAMSHINDRAGMVQTHNGVKFKSLPARLNKQINLQKRKMRRSDVPAGSPVFESFENWDGEIGWLPEGWTRKSINEQDSCFWTGADAELLFSGSDGSYCMVSNFNPNDTIDEWLITPAVDVKAGMNLSYLSIDSPFFFYDMTQDEDWNFVNNGPKGDVQVLISEDDGANWTTLYSAMEATKDMTPDEIFDISGYEFTSHSYDLSAYDGKTCKVAFRHMGKDTNIVAFDGVSIGFPPVELMMATPMAQLYYGIGEDLTSLSGVSIGYNPVYAPLTWSNYSESEDAEYAWGYYDNEGNEMVSTDFDLTVTYTPKYEEGADEAETIIESPMLYGQGEKYSAAYLMLDDAFKVGGKPSLYDSEAGVNFNLGATVADFGRCDFTYSYDFWDGTMYFGYSAGTDEYWNNYSFEGTQDENNWAHLRAIMNIHISPETPMVINGGWVPVAAEFVEGNASKANFKMEIIPLDEDGAMEAEALATAVCTGDALVGSDGMYSIPFKFDTPIEISSERCPMYAIRFSGFRDAENIVSLTPFHTEGDDLQGRFFGWLEKEICFEGNTDYSLSAIGDYTGKANAFFIMLDAEYSYLEAADYNVELENGVEKVVALDSYFDGAQVNVSELPEWLTVTVSGKGQNAKAVFKANAGIGAESEVTLSVPGAAKTFSVSVTADNSGVSTLNASTREGVYYNLQGIKVAKPIKGETYILTRGGKATKVVF